MFNDSKNGKNTPNLKRFRLAGSLRTKVRNVFNTEIWLCIVSSKGPVNVTIPQIV